MPKPILIKGGIFSDERGLLLYNNDFDVTEIKRMYIIKNKSPELIRGWQGHKIEQRWFSVICGEFLIKLLAVDNWESPSKDLEVMEFQITASNMSVLHVPAGYISSIQSTKENAKLLVMSDYLLGSIKDEYRYDIKYFEDIN